MVFRRVLTKMVKELKEHPDATPLIIGQTVYTLLKEVTIRTI
jgi:hypothetical protein